MDNTGKKSGEEFQGANSPSLHHIGVSVITLAPTYFISKRALILLLILSKSQALVLYCDFVLGQKRSCILKLLVGFLKERHLLFADAFLLIQSEIMQQL